MKKQVYNTFVAKGGIFLKKTIDSVIEIDKKAKEMVAVTLKDLDYIQKKTKDELLAMENKAIEDAKKTAQEKYDAIIEDYKRKSELEKKKGDDQLRKMDEIYQQQKSDLVDLAFSRLIRGEKNA